MLLATLHIFKVYHSFSLGIIYYLLTIRVYKRTVTTNRAYCLSCLLILSCFIVFYMVLDVLIRSNTSYRPMCGDDCTMYIIL